MCVCALDGWANKRTNERCNLYYENLLWCHIKYIGCCSIVRCTVYSNQSVLIPPGKPIAAPHRIAQYNARTDNSNTTSQWQRTAIHHALLIQFIRFYKYFSVIFIGCVVSLTCVSIAYTMPRQNRQSRAYIRIHEHTHTHNETVTIQMLSIHCSVPTFTTMKIEKNNSMLRLVCWFFFHFILCFGDFFLLKKKPQAFSFFIVFLYVENI